MIENGLKSRSGLRKCERFQKSRGDLKNGNSLTKIRSGSKKVG